VDLVRCDSRILSDYERGFLNGIIDGEGCLSLFIDKEQDVHMRMIVANNSLPLLTEVQRLIGGRIQEKYKEGYSTQYELRVYGITLRWLLPQLSFLTVEKENRRKAFIKFLETKEFNRRWKVGEREKALSVLINSIEAKVI
jgi:hypothetical protein